MNPTNTNPLYTDPMQQVNNTLDFNQQVVQNADPLALDIPDDELERIIDKRIKDSEKFYEEKYNLTERRRKNEMYLFGRQIGEKEKQGKLKDYEARSSDNALYEIEATLKPLAMSQLPDILVTPGGDDPQKQQSAKDLTIVIDDSNKKRNVRDILGLAFKHLPVYFTAVLKAKWNSEKGIDGDYEFCLVNPEYIVVDHTATSRNVDDMGYIAQCVPMTVQELLMKFPSKKQQIYESLQTKGIMIGGEPTWREMASEVKVWEVHFDWYKKESAPPQSGDDLANKQEMQYQAILEPGIKWKKVAGVLWKYEHVILDKMLDPNFDHVGEEKMFTYTDPSDETTKQEVQSKDLLMSALTGQQIPNLKKERVYHNYFTTPHKPFYFFGYDQWGKIAYDETSRIEQNIRNQENLDDQNKTIIDQLQTRIKHIWGGESGLRKADIQRLDMDNPRMDVRVEGDPNKVHKAIEPERPDSAQFNALSGTRDRMYAIAGSFAVRGQMQSDVATTNQIGREADFSRSDDLVEDTVNAASEWMARWQMQFIKLRYTSEHMKEILGPKGETTYIRLRRDSISDGMEVRIKSSSTDKLKAQRNAMQTAQLGPPYTNPLDFFQDMGMSDPDGRTERGVMFATDPEGYFAKYVLKLPNTPMQVQALNGSPIGAGAPQPSPAGPPQAPQQPSVGDTSAAPPPPPALPSASPRML